MPQKEKAARPPQSVSLAITGSGGAGVMTTGGLLLEAVARSGWYGLQTRSVGPQIRGGEAAALMRLSTVPVEVHDGHFDALLAVDWRNIERFAAEIRLRPDSVIVADPAAGAVPDAIAGSGARIAELPVQTLAESVPGGRPNMVMLGAAGSLVGVPQSALDAVIDATLGRKGADAVSAGIAAAHAGYAAAQELGADLRLATPEAGREGRWIISGNEATGLGAVRGGVRFAAAYPITPATEILEWLAPALSRVGGTLVQAEDELASINMIIGASYGGVPSVTATSGPGLALMSEALGLATAAEIPVVVIDVTRGGPSTGIPTKSEQSDLNIAVYGLHGDAPHVVVAPTSLSDCLFAAQWAVHLAEAMQTPVIVLSDQFLGQAKAVIDRPADIAFLAQRLVEKQPAETYSRYAVTSSGVSPMTLPGTPGGQYTADGLEHNPRGTPSSSAHDHNAQLDKRLRKIEGFDYGAHWAEIDGDGPLALVTWGSSTGAAREAAAAARAEGMDVRLVSLRLLAPARPEAMAEALAGVERILVVEQTHGAQFHKYLRAHYELPGEVRSFSRPGPLMINPAEILDRIREWS